MEENNRKINILAKSITCNLIFFGKFNFLKNLNYPSTLFKILFYFKYWSFLYKYKMKVWKYCGLTCDPFI